MTVVYSILIPLYNGVEYLEEAVLSVISQTYKEWEILIGINGHGNNGGGIVDKVLPIVSLDPQRIRLIIQNITIQGKVESLHDLVAKTRSNWICLLDCDDKWEPEKLERQHKARLSVAKKAGVIGTHARYFGESSEIPSIPSGFIRRGSTLQSNPIINSSCMIRKDLAHWSNDCYELEDYDLWLRCDLEGVIMYNLDDIKSPLVWHRIHKTSAFNSRHIDPAKLVEKYRTKFHNNLKI